MSPFITAVARGLATVLATFVLMASAAAGDAGITVEKAWMPAPPNGAKVAAGYMTVRNGTDRDITLVDLTSPIATRNELHTMSMDNGVMRMRKLEAGLKVPAGETVLLKPGGKHLMFMGLTRPPKAGDTVAIVLKTAAGTELPVTLNVAPLGTRVAPNS
ncbi:MAG: copper chaperone PCu(A)C [Pseudomonadota bacterium]